MRIRRSTRGGTSWRGLLGLAGIAAITAITGMAGTATPADAQMINHGGGVMVSAKVIFIFWGPTFSNPASPDHTYATTLQAYRNQLGTTSVYNVLTDYGVSLSNLGSGVTDWFDTRVPPTQVTDLNIQSEIRAYLSTHSLLTSAVYEVVLPSTSYSTSLGSYSCGGPVASYCAYHSWIGSVSTSAIKYAVQPYPSCAGCQVTGWTAAQNQEHFVLYDTANAVTDPVGTTWWDASGREVGDPCVWSPAPYIGTGAYAYQYLWSNSLGLCRKTK
jgi:hypothetical protein